LPDYRARIEERIFAILTAVASVASELKIDWLIVGAAGRVLLLEEVYKLPRGRATEDVDYGVMVDSWDHYQAFVERLCKDPRVHKDGKQAQRLRFSDYGIIDLVPFGGVESDGQLIRWPPDGDFVMNVAGFQEAYVNAVQVLVNDTLMVRVVSPVGLLLLKLVAWEDRKISQPGKDATDIAYVLRQGPTLIGEENLYGEYFDTATATGFDLELAAARALGRKLRDLTFCPTGDHVRKILQRELADGIESKLAREVAKSMVPPDETRSFDLLSQVMAGLAESGSKTAEIKV
jgi:predicted nucleotidyltransferase